MQALFTPIAPKNIRAGRVVVELTTEEVGDASLSATIWSCHCMRVGGYYSSSGVAMQAPKASENFRCLCTGEKGVGKASKKALHYKARLPSQAHILLLLETCNTFQHTSSSWQPSRHLFAAPSNSKC